jgi:hypothetical protein
MYSSNRDPKWWQVYLTFPLLLGLFVLDGRLKISSRGHQAVQIGIILLVYMLIHVWLKSNARALSHADRIRYGKNVRVISFIPDPGDDRQTIFKITGSEVKGVLSDTFEMDTIDGTLLPLEDVSGKLNKE